jgi:hypothetical protein
VFAETIVGILTAIVMVSEMMTVRAIEMAIVMMTEMVNVRTNVKVIVRVIVPTTVVSNGPETVMVMHVLSTVIVMETATEISTEIAIVMEIVDLPRHRKTPMPIYEQEEAVI